MAGTHGGARPGAGRPKKASKASASSPGRYADALAYLAAVVRGDEPPDGLRVAAARALLPYQSPKAAVPVESPPPRALRAKQVRQADAEASADWEQKAAAVRARHGRTTKEPHG